MDDALVVVDFALDLLHVRLIERFTKRVLRVRSSMTGHTQTRHHRRRTNLEFHERLHANGCDVANDGPATRMSRRRRTRTSEVPRSSEMQPQHVDKGESHDTYD